MIQPNHVVLFQGDSITDAGRNRDDPDRNGYGGGLGRGYALLAAGRVLADRPADGLRFYNRGISGNRVVDLYARWKIDALNLKPNLLSILIGVNDTWHGMGDRDNGVEPPRFEKMYRELLTWTRQVLPDVRLVLCEPFVLEYGAVTADWLDEMAERRDIVKRLADEFNAVHVPFQTLFDELADQAPPEFWLPDGVHPTPAAHTKMADMWLNCVVGG
jgi:lysophospholipase L1-like esterase